jgi:hypothetical protein
VTIEHMNGPHMPIPIMASKIAELITAVNALTDDASDPDTITLDEYAIARIRELETQLARQKPTVALDDRHVMVRRDDLARALWLEYSEENWYKRLQALLADSERGMQMIEADCTITPGRLRRPGP